MSSPSALEIESGTLADQAYRQVAASWCQERLWFIDQLEGGGNAYNIPLAARLTGKLDRSALMQALDGLVQRHESLRTVFVNDGGTVQQRIAVTERFALQSVDLAGFEGSKLQAEISAQRSDEASAGFDLSRGPLIRGRLLSISDEEHILLVTMHHIIADGWSLGVLLREFGAMYSAFAEGRANELPPLSMQYADYAVWQRAELKGEVLDRELSYWRDQLGGAPPEVALPTDRGRPAAQSYRGGNVQVTIGSRLTADLKALARRQKMTLFMLLSAGWALLLSRLSGQSDLVIGTPVANRQRSDLEGLIGFFVNTLALRIEVLPQEFLQDYLARVRRATIGAYNHQDVPFERVVSALRPDRSLSRNPIFQVMFALQNAPKGELELPGLTVAIEDGSDEPALFDLFLSLEERGSEMAGSVNYASDLFERSSIERWVESFKAVLVAMARGENRRIADIDFVPPDQRDQVMIDFNATRAPYPQEKTVHELFEEQARRTPDAVAAEHEGRSLTYGELHGRANRLARYLVSQGVGADQVVGICMERGLEMVVGVLGIMKAGGAYLPLDPSYPADRLAQMLEDAAPRIVLTQSGLLEVLPPSAAEVIALDEKLPQIGAFQDENITPSELGLSSESLVYVIYTSGSTGRPKGTAMRHRSVVNLIEWHRRTFGAGEGRRVLQFAALSFDVAFQEIFSTLCTGGELVLIDEWVRRDARALTEVLQRRSVERIFVPPLMLQTLAEYGKSSGEVPASLKDVITAGEQLRVSAEIRDFFRRIPGVRLHNHYGPTETHVVTALTLERDPGAWPDLPAIGGPIANTQIYVLDAYRQPVPIGVSGEVYIGGANVARGYLNRPELTEQRFVVDPFSNDPQARLYKTGDLGRWRVDGTLEYLGRNDDQVKIRGYRIELGEIEAQLARHGQVREAAVIAREDVPGEKRLVAYLVQRSEQPVGADELRAHLKAALPEYMVPSAFVVLEKLPLTPSGKLDRRALPAPELDAYVRHEYEAPQGPVEEVLAGIWQQLLRVERVGRNDNFFELGGHSLLIVQMLERMRRVGLSAEVRRVFESPTLAELAATLFRGTVDEITIPPNLIPPGCQKITPEMLPLVELEQAHIDRIVQSVPGGAANVQDIYPLTPLQEGMLFHHLLSTGTGDAYVIPLLIQFASNVSLSAFINALNIVIRRHDILRTAIHWEHLPRPIQVVYRHAAIILEEIRLETSLDTKSQIKACMRPERLRIDLRHAPLMKVQTAIDAAGSCYAILQLHHSLCDHDSLESMFGEVLRLSSGRTVELENSESYRNHVALVLMLSEHDDAATFFRHKLSDVEGTTAPFGLTDVRGTGAKIKRSRQKLPSDLGERIRFQAMRFAVTPATIFHAAWAMVLCHTTGNDDVVFGTLLSGRFQGRAGAGKALGMFINTLPLRIRATSLCAKGLIIHLQREIVELLEHEHASLAMAQRCSAVSATAPLFTSLLNYRHSAINLETEFERSGGMKLLEVESLTNYPVVFSVEDTNESFDLEMEVHHSIDADRALSHAFASIEALVTALERNDDSPALHLEILSPAERRDVIETFNSTELTYHVDGLIHSQFEYQVEKTPTLVAIDCDGEQLTYAELNRRANKVAWTLRHRGVGPEQLVGIYMERSVEMVVALLGVLKAGGAYVPLDPSYPTERISFMLEEAAPLAILTQQGLAKSLPQTQVPSIELDREWREISTAASHNPRVEEVGLRTTSLAYVIYTSGSTGRPKGAMNEHGAVVNRIAWMQDKYGLGVTDRILQKTPYTFDVSVPEFFATLSSGARLVIARPGGHQEPAYLLDVIEKEGITRLHFVPSMLQIFLDHCGPGHCITVRHVVCSGEELPPSLVRQFLSYMPHARISNLYGPTECAVDVTAWDCPQGEQISYVPIGRPIANTCIYILDGRLAPVPIGVAGEMYIGGLQVGRGYIKRPDLTSKRFLGDPFSRAPGARMYRTGDLGRWREDGLIEYIGRNDNQVKLRGLRIELEEIRARILDHDGLQNAVVVAGDDARGQKRLLAYVVPRDPRQSPATEQLRDQLRAALPDYMIPSAFVTLERLPLTASGKIDKKALPEPEEYLSVREYEPPQSRAEDVIANIFEKMFKVPRIGRYDNFFELGGHSLDAVRLIEHLEEFLKVRIPMQAIFRHSTVNELAAYIDSRQEHVESAAGG